MSDGLIGQQSRRDLLKKGAAVGAVAWTAPMLISSPAFAATAKCGGSKPCVNFYIIKSDGAASDGSCPVTVTDCNGQTASLQNGSQWASASHAGTVATIQFSAGSVPLVIMVKPGPNCLKWTYNQGSNTLTPTGAPQCATAIIQISGSVATGLNISIDTSPCYQQAISHVTLYYCR